MKPYYEHAGIQIFCCDCREILPTLLKFDLLLTDPPYGIGHLMRGGKNTGHWNHLFQGNDWDMETPDMSSVLPSAMEAVVWGGNYFPLPLSRCWLAWRKLNAVPTQADMELAWTSMDACARVFDYPSGGAFDRCHPTQKPLALRKWCLSLFPKAKSVLDPFLGSGTTLVAAKSMGLTGVGIEREEKYAEIAAKRLSQEVFEFDSQNDHYPAKTGVEIEQEPVSQRDLFDGAGRVKPG
jgi:site-specific DNA-methyltransferase (adenine-specific)